MVFTTIDDAKKAVGTFEVPGGYLLKDEDGEVYRLNQLTMREISGHEEDIMADDDISFTERLYQVFGRCITKIADDDGHAIIDPEKLISVPDGLLFSDIMVMFKSLYQITVGNQLFRKVLCDSGKCKNKQTEIINLEDIEVLPVKGDPAERVREYKTSRGTDVTWELLSGKIDRTYDAGNDESSKDMITMLMLRRVRTINGEPATKENLKDLPSRERIEIRNQFEDEGGIETRRHTRCRKCHKHISYDLRVVDFDFFTSQEELKD